jgi:hypothetical protein
MDQAGAVLVHPYGGRTVRACEFRNLDEVREDSASSRVGAVERLGQTHPRGTSIAVFL